MSMRVSWEKLAESLLGGGCATCVDGDARDLGLGAVGSRNRILKAAAMLFRERGFDGVGLAEIMKAAGLTHGGV